MGKKIQEAIRRFKGEKVVSFEEIQRLYGQENVKSVSFSSDGAKFYIKKVYMVS